MGAFSVSAMPSPIAPAISRDSAASPGRHAHDSRGSVAGECGATRFPFRFGRCQRIQHHRLAGEQRAGADRRREELGIEIEAAAHGDDLAGARAMDIDDSKTVAHIADGGEFSGQRRGQSICRGRSGCRFPRQPAACPAPARAGMAPCPRSGSAGRGHLADDSAERRCRRRHIAGDGDLRRDRRRRDRQAARSDLARCLAEHGVERCLMSERVSHGAALPWDRGTSGATIFAARLRPIA